MCDLAEGICDTDIATQTHQQARRTLLASYGCELHSLNLHDVMSAGFVCTQPQHHRHIPLHTHTRMHTWMHACMHERTHEETGNGN